MKCSGSWRFRSVALSEVPRSPFRSHSPISDPPVLADADQVEAGGGRRASGTARTPAQRRRAYSAGQPVGPCVRSCEKIEKPGPDTFFAPRNRLKIRNCPARKGLSVPDFAIFSQLLTLGASLTIES